MTKRITALLALLLLAGPSLAGTLSLGAVAFFIVREWRHSR